MGGHCETFVNVELNVVILQRQLRSLCLVVGLSCSSLRAPETLSSLSKSRISIFNAHLTLLVRRMTSHNSIGKYRHYKLTWNLPWNGA